MQTDFPMTARSTTIAVAQNRVLRNTYMLLALSMIPTVVGAWLGVSMKFTLLAGHPFIASILFLAGAFGFFYAIERNKNSGVGVGLLLAFTFFMGLWLSQLLQVAFLFKNGATAIGYAGVATSAIFATMAGIATVTKRDFSFMGKFLFIGMVLLLVAMLANVFFQIPALALTLSTLAVLIFSGFMLYDLGRIVNGGETNYVSATLALYLDIYNVFVSLVQLILAFTGERE